MLPESRGFRPSFHFGVVTALLGLLLPAVQAEAQDAVPFAVRSPSEKEVAGFQTAWAGALLAFRDGRFDEAAQRLRPLQPTERAAQIYRTAFFAEASLAAGHRHDADSALDATLRWTRGMVWQRHFYRLRLASFDFDAASPAVVKAFCFQALKAPLDPAFRAEFLYPLLKLNASALSESERMDITLQLLRDAPADFRLEGVYRSLALRFSSCCGNSWQDQKLLMDFEEKLGYTDKALDRGAAMLSLAPGNSQKQVLELRIANLEFRKGAYAEALRRYQKYGDDYGESSELLQDEARAYRKLSEESKARLAYFQLVDQFPRSPKSADVYWMWAFDAESEGRMKEAIETYSRLISEFPEGPYAEKAAFRIGFVYYKRGDFAAADQAFQDARGLNPSSRILPAEIYWEAKSQEAQGDSVSARSGWADLNSRFPFSFYGHLARFDLRSQDAWPESLDWDHRFPSSRPPEVKDWLAAHAPGFRDSIDASGESVYLPVSRLLEWKMDTLAVLTLRGLPPAFLSNPWALYIAGRRCQQAGLWSEAYRFGTLLGGILPIEEWAGAPRSVLRLLYPPAYQNAVRSWATRDGIPAGLVFGLMKQESGFDANIASRAGARGLMQMMPSTGALQAKGEGISNFTADALFVPQTNVRLGVAYLRDVERRYHGNLYLTLAHYNAGPEALAGWKLRMTDRQADEIVEDIGYTETRDYVKRVLANYWTYQALYD